MDNEPVKTEETPQTPSDAELPEQLSIFGEFMFYLRENKKWWLIPIIVVMLLLGALVFLGSSPASPFIYTLF